MAMKSTYKCLQPLMVLCYIMGQFAVVSVTVERSDLLRYHCLSKSLTGLILEIGSCWVFQLWWILIDNIVNLFVDLCVLHYVIVCIKFELLRIWFYLGSKNVVKAFQAVDRLRETLTMIPVDIRPKTTDSSVFLWYSGALLFMVSLTVEDGILYTSMRGNFSRGVLFTILFEGTTISLQAVTLTFLFNSCSPVIEESTRAWCRYRDGSLLPRNYVKSFCQLLLNQVQILEEIDRALGKNVLVILLYRISNILDATLIDAQVDYAEISNLNTIVWWSSCLGLLFLPIILISRKMECLAGEVLESVLSPHGISKREAARMKLLMTQLRSRPKTFSAAEFIELTPELFLSLLSLGIEYLIFLWQNKTFIRTMMGLEDLMTSVNTTMYNKLKR